MANTQSIDDTTLSFVNDIVQTITGYSIDEIPEANRAEMVGDCVKVFSDFVLKYVEAKYGKKDAIRLKSSQLFAGQDIFNKFNDLGDKLKEALDFFVDQRLAHLPQTN